MLYLPLCFVNTGKTYCILGGLNHTIIPESAIHVSDCLHILIEHSQKFERLQKRLKCRPSLSARVRFTSLSLIVIVLNVLLLFRLSERAQPRSMTSKVLNTKIMKYNFDLTRTLRKRKCLYSKLDSGRSRCERIPLLSLTLNFISARNSS